MDDSLIIETPKSKESRVSIGSLVNYSNLVKAKLTINKILDEINYAFDGDGEIIPSPDNGLNKQVKDILQNSIRTHENGLIVNSAKGISLFEDFKQYKVSEFVFKIPKESISDILSSLPLSTSEPISYFDEGVGHVVSELAFVSSSKVGYILNEIEPFIPLDPVREMVAVELERLAMSGIDIKNCDINIHVKPIYESAGMDLLSGNNPVIASLGEEFFCFVELEIIGGVDKTSPIFKTHSGRPRKAPVLPFKTYTICNICTLRRKKFAETVAMINWHSGFDNDLSGIDYRQILKANALNPINDPKNLSWLEDFLNSYNVKVFEYFSNAIEEILLTSQEQKTLRDYLKDQTAFFLTSDLNFPVKMNNYVRVEDASHVLELGLWDRDSEFFSSKIVFSEQALSSQENNVICNKHSLSEINKFVNYDKKTHSIRFKKKYITGEYGEEWGTW